MSTHTIDTVNNALNDKLLALEEMRARLAAAENTQTLTMAMRDDAKAALDAVNQVSPRDQLASIRAFAAYRASSAVAVSAFFDRNRISEAERKLVDDIAILNVEIAHLTQQPFYSS